ncbi:DUF1826 domain-containing protein [Archangium violaceum]|uniref:DUF1826 domain-containing protein n=1 Tax=Archangium violaceum TaxID=83451 RepID=UPI00194EF08D|nr:DUF1826 domain-containing protein [Archangium violaceum]QRO00182.1 DUF1826 domain-containing protein [Archangium violaceum]
MPLSAPRPTLESCVTVSEAADLVAIFEKHVNLCVWERPVDEALAHWLREVCATHDFLEVRQAHVGDPALGGLLTPLPESPGRSRFQQELAGLVELYADLFGAERVGLRLGTFDAPMCPRFHVDRVGVRLLCTYAGPGTEYLEERDARRARLGAPVEGSGGTDDIAWPGAVTRHLAPFAVGLLKGETWPDNEGYGTIHRSPPGSERRLLLSVDLL